MTWMWWLVTAAAIVALCTLADRRGWIDLSNKTQRSGSGAPALGSIGDEVFNPVRYETQLELDRQTVLPAPAPVAGDGDRGVYAGRLRIDLP